MQLACLLSDILPGTGVCALIKGRQVALMRPTRDEQVFAIDNRDPFYQSNVLSRGLIGEHDGEFWVASPLKKQRFRLTDGICLDNPAVSLTTYRVELRGQEVWVGL
ncbi:assimilatory nitrite reductase (NAD(P)H) small subunit [Aeromonas sp. RU39B]|uniref:nitrite reductase small subunit NirD n=1 Tax=Aeromonas sp. RU39B TaxID=1907416 RepID=UPI0009540BF4|nr:nitrite reductase small subunit NirD [Aeromonas sp. RU39B]SIR21159.1 assimilatory nitrite reductase (NAD(P)H) small subunit [Aeromonas sp. RU39B]